MDVFVPTLAVLGWGGRRHCAIWVVLWVLRTGEHLRFQSWGGGDRSVSMLVGLRNVHSFLWLGIVGDVPFSSEALILGLVTDSGVPLLVVAGPGVFFLVKTAQHTWWDAWMAVFVEKLWNGSLNYVWIVGYFGPWGGVSWFWGWGYNTSFFLFDMYDGF